MSSHGRATGRGGKVSRYPARSKDNKIKPVPATQAQPSGASSSRQQTRPSPHVSKKSLASVPTNNSAASSRVAFSVEPPSQIEDQQVIEEEEIMPPESVASKRKATTPGNKSSTSQSDDSASDLDLDPALALENAKKKKKSALQSNESISKLQELLEKSEKDRIAMQQDLLEEQESNYRLRQNIQKRTRDDAVQDVPRNVSEVGEKDNYSRAFEAGKRFAALYCPFGTKKLIFGPLERLNNPSEGEDDDAELGQGGEDEEEDEAEKGFERQMNPEEAASRNKVTADGEYDFFAPADQTAYIEDSATMFWRDLPTSDKKGSDSKRYRSRFMAGMSRGRSAFITSTSDAKLVFNFELSPQEFAVKSNRKNLPPVAALLDNSMFIVQDGTSKLAYRHICLIQILRRVLHGPAALLLGGKAKKARTTYQDQWRLPTIPLELLAWTATVAHHILIGEEELSQSKAIRDVFWKHMHFLTEIRDKNADAYKALIHHYDYELKLIPTDKKGNGLKPAEAELLAEILGTQ